MNNNVTGFLRNDKMKMQKALEEIILYIHIWCRNLAVNICFVSCTGARSRLGGRICIAFFEYQLKSPAGSVQILCGFKNVVFVYMCVFVLFIIVVVVLVMLVLRVL